MSRRHLRIAGAIATAVALAGLALVSRVVASVPFPPVAVSERIVRVTPGDIATFFIDLLQLWAERLFVAGVVLVSVALGAEVLARLSNRRPNVLAAGFLLGMMALVASMLSPSVDVRIGYLGVACLGAALVYAATARIVLEVLRAKDSDADEGRRRALKYALAGAGGLAVGGGVLAWAADRFAGPNTDVTLMEPAVAAEIPERAPFPDIPGLSPEITSVEDHYTVDINFFPPSVEADGWRLAVHGEVERPMALGFNDLQTRFDVVEEFVALSCISNEVGGDLVGNSRWGGVRLADVLEDAGVRSGAVDVIFRAADGYSDSIPLEIALDPTVLIAVSQNGRPLEQEHGFPARIRVPQIYGMKNVKWLEEIQVVASDYKGYWMQRGWSDEAVVKTQSRIDVPSSGDRLRMGDPAWIAGVAWAGNRGISKVEVSTDGGGSWNQAMLKDPLGPLSRRLWAYRWTPTEKGDHEIVARATDGDGATQPSAETPPHPDGAAGWHTISIATR